MFEKFMFWKKEEPAMLEKPIFGEEPKIPEFGSKDDLGAPNAPGPSFGMEIPPPGAEPSVFGAPPSEPSAFGASPAETPAFGASPSLPPAFGQPQVSQPQAPQPPPQYQSVQPVSGNMTLEILSKDIALLSSKLDTLRVQLDQINHRLDNIERVVMEEDKKSRTW